MTKTLIGCKLDENGNETPERLSLHVAEEVAILSLLYEHNAEVIYLDKGDGILRDLLEKQLSFFYEVHTVRYTLEQEIG